jgi:short-subunit dehydrogenase
MPLKVVVLGGTKGMGRALAREFASRGDRVHLLGRTTEDLARCAADLESRSPGQPATGISYSLCDLERPDTFSRAIADAASALGGFDTVVITAGLFATQAQLEADPVLTRRVLTVNFTHTVLFCEQVRSYLVAHGGGTLCVFSSVAGDRGRKPVVLYGASKAGLSAYLEGLDHKFRAQGLVTVCVKPGFVRTAMTEGLPEPPFAGTPEQVAGVVLRAIDRKEPVVYAPAIWALVMAAVRRLPRFVMRRVGF